ncbi:MAG: hypothetical protein ACRELF_04855 [Gemmataceae bacterium]
MKYEMTWQVDADGVLRFALELGKEYANKVVRLTVASLEPPPDASPLTDEERRKSIADLAGKWKGDFERPFQGEEVRVGANGLLTLPLGQANANKLVRVIVEGAERATDASAKNRAERRQAIEGMAGTISDPTFKRHPQGDYEQRDEL